MYFQELQTPEKYLFFMVFSRNNRFLERIWSADIWNAGVLTEGVWSQHDEVETNLKKILHTNGIWGLEANAM